MKTARNPSAPRRLIGRFAFITSLGLTVLATASHAVTAAAPVFSPGGGTYTGAQSVTITSTTTGASIKYTEDGSTPTTQNGTLYSGPVTISANTTLQAIAWTGAGSNKSAVTSATYVIQAGTQVAAPTFSPPGGAYSGSQTVTITSTTTGASIRYTTDGSAPSSSTGTLYSGAVAVNSSETLRAIAYKSGSTSSAVVDATYTIGGGKVSTPMFSPAAGPFYASTPVTITSATAGATIRYTTDGSTPTSTHGTLYSGPVTMQQPVNTDFTAPSISNASGVTMLKAIAYKSGAQDSGIFTGNYIIIVPLRYAKTSSLILGLAHMAYNVSSTNWNSILSLWTDYLGYGTVTVTSSFALIKINDQQYIELYKGPVVSPTFQLANYGFYVSDAEAYRQQLSRAGIQVPSSCTVNALGNLSFFTTDPDGHRNEWVQYLPGSVTSQSLGQNMPGTQLFGYMEDYGVSVASVTAADTYYRNCGFGSGSTKVYLPNNNCYMEMLTYATFDQTQVGKHEKAQLVTFRGTSALAAANILQSRNSSIPQTRSTEGGSGGMPTHDCVDVYDADLSRIRMIDINY